RRRHGRPMAGSSSSSAPLATPVKPRFGKSISPAATSGAYLLLLELQTRLGDRSCRECFTSPSLPCKNRASIRRGGFGMKRIALVLAATSILALGACKKQAPQELPPPPQSSAAPAPAPAPSTPQGPAPGSQA